MHVLSLRDQCCHIKRSDAAPIRGFRRDKASLAPHLADQASFRGFAMSNEAKSSLSQDCAAKVVCGLFLSIDCTGLRNKVQGADQHAAGTTQEECLRNAPGAGSGFGC